MNVNGDEHPLVDAWIDHRKTLFQFAYRSTNDRALAKDIVAEVAFEVLNFIESGTALNCDPKIQLFRFTRSLTIKLGTGKARFGRLHRERFAVTNIDDQVIVGPDVVLSSVLENDLSAYLAEALGWLDPQLRSVVVLTVAFGFSVAETARVTETPRTTVHYQRKKGLALLQVYLAESGIDA